jgi:uncharacterized protein (TIGR02001 family)
MNWPTVKVTAVAFIAVLTTLESQQAWAQMMSSTQKARTDVAAAMSVDYASAYIFRGTTVNSKSVVQPALELTVGDRAQIGLWGNFPVGREEEELKQEVDIYARYAVPFDLATLVVGAWEYTYPENDVQNDREIEATIALNTLLSPTLSAYFGVDGAAEDNEYYEFALSQDLLQRQALSLNIGGKVGYQDNDVGEDGFNHALLTLAAGYEILNASANWVFETDEDVNDLAGQENFYLSVGTGYSF